MYQSETIVLRSQPYEKEMTVYQDPDVTAKACILYFHGGGLLYGSRDDLPELHLTTMTGAGYVILSFDYPLAPASKLEEILDDVLTSINSYKERLELAKFADLPYFLWGRSAGAYLCLIAAASGKIKEAPAGILSYYGYGFLGDNWYNYPSKYYQTLPAVPETCLDNIPQEPHAEGDLETHYSVYVYARQTGKWKDLIYDGRDKYFYLYYSLRACTSLPPLFCTHSVNDNDVPYTEFTALCNLYNPARFIAATEEHDFDRDVENPFTEKVLKKSVEFLDKHC